MNTPKYLSRGIDYLGDIGAKLRDLQGFATLAHELIQNADDAPEAFEMSFNVRQDALIVDNDGYFSDCGDIGNDQCRWKVKGKHLCDFHRFRKVASGNKREEADTTGAFGIGFISVYQITDQPELISAGQHWILHEEREEAKRIEVCQGCSRCRDPQLARTRFIFPWARDPNSALRQALRIETCAEQDSTTLLTELEQSIPTAMLFLKKIRQIDILRNGQLVKRLERFTKQDDLVIKETDCEPQRWHLLRSDFDDQAYELRERHGRRIEDKRRSDVTIAIPHMPLDKGLLCASLPTQFETGLPFHINADFFPSSDRKRILFESEYQSEWNRAAIHAAAETLRDNLDELRTILGHKRLWELIEATKNVADEAQHGRREKSLSDFWKLLAPQLPQSQVVFSTKGTWCKPSEVFLLESKDEEEAISLLESLEIPIVHTDLRPHFGLLRDSQVGVQLLDVPHITTRLQKIGLDRQVSLSAVPPYLRKPSQRQVLWREFALLLKRRRKPEEQKDVEQKIAACALVLGCDGALWPYRDIYRADDETRTLFNRIAPNVPFVAEKEEENNLLKSLCPVFTAEIGARVLNDLDQPALVTALTKRLVNPLQLLGWFDNRRNEVLKSLQLKEHIARLPIFPCAIGWRALIELALPGDFEDPIGLANLVDLGQLEGRRDFLRDLGARELDFQRYVLEYIPRAFMDSNVPTDKKRRAIRLLAERLGEIKGNSQTQSALVPIPIVECEDGVFRKPRQVYLPSKNIADILGSVHIAVIPSESTESVRDLYTWLGVSTQPRFEDIVARIQRLCAQPPTQQSLQAIRNIFEHLGERLRKDSEETSALLPLRELAWLPARGDSPRWYKPQDVYAIFQDYLFETQARFLDIPRETQNASGRLLAMLGIKSVPQPYQVVAHLLECAKRGVAVNREVYRFLNDNANDPAIDRLKDTACLLLPDNSTYVKPNQVFWSEHSFGRFRYRLSPELRQYGELFTRLGVRDAPNATDAIAVLTEIAPEFGNRSLDDEAHAVLFECWKILERARETGEIDENALVNLSSLRVIPNKQRILREPANIFFEDRAGLANKFGNFLEHDVIERPSGAWRAMEVAGVRSLAQSVRSHLVECVEQADNGLVESRFQERLDQIARVLDLKDVTRLNHLSFQATSELQVQYSLDVFGKHLMSEPEKVPAHFLRDESVLYFVHDDHRIPWPFIARELALAICPDEEPGRFALGIKEVLASESEHDARVMLDQLGFPPLEIVNTDNVGPGKLIEGLGGQETPTPAAPPISTIQPQPTEQPFTPKQAIKAILGEDAPPPTPPPPGLIPPEIPRGKKSKAGKQRGRFRTYVYSNDGYAEDPDLTERRSKLGQAGEKRALKFEEQHGRFAKPMEINHKGYDIESRDADGNIVRYIEVKAIGTGWGSAGVGMSDSQFQKALELGDKFWLYVVERAERDDYQIYPIQDPARKANQFVYDDGWKQVSEE